MTTSETRMPIRIKLCCGLMGFLVCTNIGYAIYILARGAATPERNAAVLSILIGICYAFCALGLLIRKAEARLCSAIILLLPCVMLAYRFSREALIPRIDGFPTADPSGNLTLGYLAGVSVMTTIWCSLVLYLLFSARNASWFTRQVSESQA